MANKIVCDACGKVALGTGYLEHWYTVGSYLSTSFFSWKKDACSIECAQACLIQGNAEENLRRNIRREDYYATSQPQ